MNLKRNKKNQKNRKLNINRKRNNYYYLNFFKDEN